MCESEKKIIERFISLARAVPAGGDKMKCQLILNKLNNLATYAEGVLQKSAGEANE